MKAAGLVAVLVATLGLAVSPNAVAGPANDRRVIATSVDGAAIVARHYGAADAPVQLVVLGQMHGSEPGGRKVVRDLAGLPVPPGVGLWLISTCLLYTSPSPRD